MAKAPRDPNAPKKARAPMKPAKFFLLYKGNIEDIRLVRSADEALDLQDQDKNWNMRRLTVPKGKNAKPADATAG